MRYSPDRKPVSTWQILEGTDYLKSASASNVLYRGQIEKQPYEDLLLQYGRQDVPWASDEAAAGTVLANNIGIVNSGRVVSTINLSGGNQVVSNTAGSRTAPVNVLNLGGGTLHLNRNGAAGVTNVFATTVTVSATTTVVLDSVTGIAFSTAYPLISYGGSDPFARLALGTLPVGFNGTLVDDPADKLISVKFNPQRPMITSLGATAGWLTFRGTGSPNAGFSLQTTTNLAIPVANWPVVGTGTINAAGIFNYTRTINPAIPAVFFLFSTP